MFHNLNFALEFLYFCNGYIISLQLLGMSPNMLLLILIHFLQIHPQLLILQFHPTHMRLKMQVFLLQQPYFFYKMIMRRWALLIPIRNNYFLFLLRISLDEHFSISVLLSTALLAWLTDESVLSTRTGFVHTVKNNYIIIWKAYVFIYCIGYLFIYNFYNLLLSLAMLYNLIKK